MTSKPHVLLLTPGPTEVPPEVLAVMAEPVIYHRSKAFNAVLEEVGTQLKKVFRTRGEVILLTASGTGGMEAAVANTLSPGDTAVVGVNGRFGERFVEIGEAFDVRVIPLRAARGRAVPPDAYAEALRTHPETRAVFTTLCDTSTGVLSDVRGIGRIVSSTPSLLVVDGISSIGAVPFEMDGWSVDLAIIGSQKALMLPPGLAFVGVSAKAWARIEATRPRSFYFDLRRARVAAAKSDTPFTPALTLVLGLRESVRILLRDGLEAAWERNARLARGARAALQALGLALFALDPADCLTAAWMPPGLDSSQLIAAVRDRHQVLIANGQDELKGKIFRIAHMGCIDAEHTLSGLTAIETELGLMGWRRAAGSARQAFLAAY
ncbi:MAG: alanine--glyoxylate aminotransferase family protein [Planctomycetes bacterium]|nr:alanine--glyoxylate aminotransferase family protein [Planctomycetota bacterium]